MSVPARTSYVSSVTWCTPSSTYCSRGFSGMCPRLQIIPTALLSGTQPAGFLQDPHSWDNTHHTAPLIPGQTPAATIWRHHHITECGKPGSQKEAATELDSLLSSLCTENRSAVARKGLPMEATKTKWPGHMYSTHDLYQHSTELLMRWPEPEPYPKIQARRQLTEILHRCTKCLQQLQATFPNTSTLHTAHLYNFECYLSSCIPSGNCSIKLREAKGHPSLASSHKSLVWINARWRKAPSTTHQQTVLYSWHFLLTFESSTKCVSPELLKHLIVTKGITTQAG